MNWLQTTAIALTTTILSMIPGTVRGSSYTVLHSFPAGSADAANQETPQLTLVGSSLYGTTRSGGSDGKGTLFRINKDGSGYQLLHSFSGSPTDGRNPAGSLVADGNSLFGMATYGGKDKGGVLFSLNTDGTGYKVLHHFFGWVYDGDNPFGVPTPDGNALYGLTARGGTNDTGVLFRINKDGSGFALLHHFAGGRGDGAAPFSDLTASGNAFYGVTYAGGTRNRGIVFRINKDGTGYQILHHFTGNTEDGANPVCHLVLHEDALFGTTTTGGTTDKGVLFSIRTDGADYRILHHFTGGNNNGANPSGSLTLVGSTLCGMTRNGGRDSNGIIYQIRTDGKEFSILHRFDPSVPGHDGADPYGGLLFSDGSLYGLTRSGGHGAGVLFRLNGVTP